MGCINDVDKVRMMNNRIEPISRRIRYLENISYPLNRDLGFSSVDEDMSIGFPAASSGST